MDDAHVLAVERGGIHLLQLGGGLGHQLAGHLARPVQRVAAQHLGGGAVCLLLGRVDDLIALLDLVAGHGVQRQAHVAAMAVGDLQHHVVDGRQVQHIGHGGVVAVLCQILGDVAHRNTAAIGGHALGQRRQRLVESAELTPLHGLAAAHRQALGGRELVVYQLGLGVLQQLHAVVGLHLGAESAGGLCVHLPCKQLQIHLLHARPPHFVQNRIFSPSCTRFRMSASSRLVSPLGSLRVTERLPPRFSAGRPPPEAMERAI